MTLRRFIGAVAVSFTAGFIAGFHNGWKWPQ